MTSRQHMPVRSRRWDRAEPVEVTTAERDGAEDVIDGIDEIDSVLEDQDVLLQYRQRPGQ